MRSNHIARASINGDYMSREVDICLLVLMAVNNDKKLSMSLNGNVKHQAKVNKKRPTIEFFIIGSCQNHCSKG